MDGEERVGLRSRISTFDIEGVPEGPRIDPRDVHLSTNVSTPLLGQRLNKFHFGVRRHDSVSGHVGR